MIVRRSGLESALMSGTTIDRSRPRVNGIANVTCGEQSSTRGTNTIEVWEFGCTDPA